MRWNLPALLTFAAVLAGCDGILGEADEPVPGVDHRVAERVLEHLLDRIEAAHAEMGPIAAFDLPEYKRLAAEAEGFQSWAEFTKRLRASRPALDIEYSRRITRRLKALIEKPGQEPDEDE